MPDSDIQERRAWNGAPFLFIVGPGGAGKTMVSAILAPMIGRLLVDLDAMFMSRIGPIDQYIRSVGYPAYKQANSQLARALASEAAGPILMVTSSGFLALDNPSEALKENRQLVAQGYSTCLLPESNLAVASDIIVERQLGRGPSRDAARERRTIRERFPVYNAAGDMTVFSAAPPEWIAAAVARRIS